MALQFTVPDRTIHQYSTSPKYRCVLFQNCIKQCTQLHNTLHYNIEQYIAPYISILHCAVESHGGSLVQERSLQLVPTGPALLSCPRCSHCAKPMLQTHQVFIPAPILSEGLLCPCPGRELCNGGKSNLGSNRVFEGKENQSSSVFTDPCVAVSNAAGEDPAY